MNRARSNPTAEGEWLASSGNPDIQDSIKYFGVDLPKLRAEFASYPPRGPAAFDRRLYEAASLHNEFLIATDSQNHLGQVERVLSSGFAFASLQASVFSYAASATDAHGAFNIDWGELPGENEPDGMQKGRYHRFGLMSLPGSLPLLSSTGISVTPERRSLTQVGPFVVTVNYATALEGLPDHHQRFVVGTVWSDANNNGRYDGGEGKGNVQVQPNLGKWHAITSASGGYAFPAENAGPLRLTFSGGQLPGAFHRSVTGGEESILVDLNAHSADPPSLELGIRVLDNSTILLEWSGGAPPYQVQSSSAISATSWQNYGAPTVLTRLAVPRTTPGKFFRVLSGR
ncbi:MAG: hypothetical protein ACR2OZ_20165 [Verrucomicrobiales bacterium]